MFMNLLSFEFKYRLKKKSTLIFFGIFFIIGFLLLLFGPSGNRINQDAPYLLFRMITGIPIFFLIIPAIFFGHAACRDFLENIHELYFSYPIKKIHYFWGRFFGAFITSLFVFSGLGLGAFTASLSGLVEPGKLGHIDALSYLHPYLVGLLPNILLVGAIFFAIGFFKRNMFPVYLVSVILLMGYMFGIFYSQNFQSSLFASLIDPFGQAAVQSIYQNWTVVERNTRLIPLAGNFLFNRMLWMGLSVVFLLIFYNKFRLSAIQESKTKKIQKEERKTFGLIDRKLVSLDIPQLFNFKNHVRQVILSVFFEFKSIAKNFFFLLILILSCLFAFINGFKQIAEIKGTGSLPVTFLFVDNSMKTVYFFFMILIIFCAGELIFRERKKKMQPIFDSLPVPEWVPFLSKLGAVMLVPVLAMLVIMVSGILIQLYFGYHHLQLALYLKELFGFRLILFLLVSVMAMFVQVMVNRKGIGYFVMLLCYFVFIDEETLLLVGLEHNLYQYGSVPAYSFSEMNGYGPFLKPLLFYNLYWICFAVFLVALGMLFWVRGNDTGFKFRIQSMKRRITRAKIFFILISLFLFLGTGSYIFYNTTILNRFESTAAMEKVGANYEKELKQWQDTPQPHIVDINVEVDLYPLERRVFCKGTLTLENKRTVDITDLFIQVPGDGKMKKLELDVQGFYKKHLNEFGVYIYKLNQPLKYKEKIVLSFVYEKSEKGFKNHHINTRLVKNGTFLTSLDIIPSIGYQGHRELQDINQREKYELPGQGSITSQSTLRKVQFQAIISTSEGQTAITSGKLVKDWIKGNRHYFHYRMERRKQARFPFISARYALIREKWQEINLELYLHINHKYDTGFMIRAIKEYLKEDFSGVIPVRIVEVPRSNQDLASYPGIIPFSEGPGFMKKF